MSSEQSADKFLKTAKEFFDHKTTADQATNSLLDQYREMQKDGSWRQAIGNMISEGNHWDSIPNITCAADNTQGYLSCHMTPSKLDWQGDLHRSIDFIVGPNDQPFEVRANGEPVEKKDR
ncbi:MAG TPA: hypothetical protein V6D22_00980 [Candidatus Obscuribacterales bacterium]